MEVTQENESSQEDHEMKDPTVLNNYAKDDPDAAPDPRHPLPRTPTTGSVSDNISSDGAHSEDDEAGKKKERPAGPRKLEKPDKRMARTSKTHILSKPNITSLERYLPGRTAREARPNPLEEENQRLKMRLDEALEYNSVLAEQYNRKLAAAKQNNDELNESLAELNKTNDVLQNELRDFQVRSFKDLSRDTWRPMEDRAVQEALEILHKDLEDWADENCIESLTDIACDANSSEARELLDCLRKVAWISEEEMEISAQLQRWAEIEIEPVLLLTALLTYAVYKSAFSKTFLILDALDPPGPVIVDSSGMMNSAPQWLPMRKSELLQSTFEKLREINEKQAHRWRSQMMRILLPNPPSGKFQGLEPANGAISEFVHLYCKNAVEQFENSPVRAFFKEELAEESRALLVQFWTKAVELFTQLQTQRAELKWLEPSEGKTLGERLKIAYERVHRSQEYSENEGRPVALVISPLVIFCGNEDGETYDMYRPVTPAVVLVLHEGM